MALTLKNSKLKTTFDYTPISQLGEDKPFSVRFNIIALDALAKLQDDALTVNKDGEYNISVNTLNYEVLKQSLIAWSNIEDDKGPIRFKRDNAGTTDSTLQLIPAEIRSELATIIVEVSKDLPNAEDYLAEVGKIAEDELEDEDNEEEAEEKVPAKRGKTTK